MEALGRFGRHAGLAFQLLDDVLDVVGAPDQTGKQRGTDLLEGTTTLPLILAGDADPELAQLDLRTIDSRERAEEVCDRIAATDALEAVRRWATDLIQDAKAEVDGNLAPSASELLGSSPTASSTATNKGPPFRERKGRFGEARQNIGPSFCKRNDGFG